MKRVLLKLSGEALAGAKKTGFDEATCIGVAEQVKKLVDDGVLTAAYGELINTEQISKNVWGIGMDRRQRKTK